MTICVAISTSYALNTLGLEGANKAYITRPLKPEMMEKREGLTCEEIFLDLSWLQGVSNRPKLLISIYNVEFSWGITGPI